MLNACIHAVVIATDARFYARIIHQIRFLIRTADVRDATQVECLDIQASTLSITQRQVSNTVFRLCSGPFVLLHVLNEPTLV